MFARAFCRDDGQISLPRLCRQRGISDGCEFFAFCVHETFQQFRNGRELRRYARRRDNHSRNSQSRGIQYGLIRQMAPRRLRRISADKSGVRLFLRLSPRQRYESFLSRQGERRRIRNSGRSGRAQGSVGRDKTHPQRDNVLDNRTGTEGRAVFRVLYHAVAARTRLRRQRIRRRYGYGRLR